MTNNYHHGIHYCVGDATRPNIDGNKIIAHICNDIGAWGRGFVLALSNTYPETERAYRSWYQQNSPWDKLPCQLGFVQDVDVTPCSIQDVNVPTNVWVCNMIAQTGILIKDGVPPIRYDALRQCLKYVASIAGSRNASVHMPRIGCGLAGGSWQKVEKIIEEELIEKGVQVYVYDLQTEDARIVPWKK